MGFFPGSFWTDHTVTITPQSFCCILCLLEIGSHSYCGIKAVGFPGLRGVEVGEWE